MGNTLGEPNWPEFHDHRHDQAIWSLTTKRSVDQPVTTTPPPLPAPDTSTLPVLCAPYSLSVPDGAW